MGGMETWIFAQRYPAMLDIAVPMACQPGEMSGRNWIMRRFIIDSIRNDPEWNNGNYTKPVRSAQFAAVYYAIRIHPVSFVPLTVRFSSPTNAGFENSKPPSRKRGGFAGSAPAITIGRPFSPSRFSEKSPPANCPARLRFASPASRPGRRTAVH